MPGVGRLFGGFACAALRTAHLEFALFFGDRLAPVGFLASFGECEVDFHAATSEAHFEGYEGEAFFGHAFVEAADLVGMEEELATAYGFVATHADGKLIGGDVHALEPQFAVDHVGVGVGELHLASSGAFHLAAEQHNAGLDHVQDGVVVPGLAIARDERVAAEVIVSTHRVEQGYR